MNAGTIIAARFGLGGVFLAAVISKLQDFSAFASVVSRASLLLELPLNPDQRIWAARAVVMLETFIATALITGLQRRWLAPLVATTLGIFTIIGVTLLLSGSKSCGCMRLPPGAARWMSTPEGLLARNTLLILAAIFVLPVRPASITSAPPDSAARHARAFTLIEMLAVIAVTGVLISLALPSARGARLRAVQTRAGATMHDLMSALQLYASSNADCFPYLQTRNAPAEPIRLPGVAPDASKSYFMGGSVYWPNAMVGSEIAPELASMLTTPGSEESNLVDNFPTQIIRSRYLLTHTAFARPGYWDDDQTPEGSGWFAPGRLTDTLYPSEKGILLDIYTPTLEPRTTTRAKSLAEPVAFADSSIGASRWDNPLDVYTPELVVQRPWGAWGRTILSTRHGLAGRDVRH